MTPVKTAACNRVYRAEGCHDLPACLGNGMVATYWRPSPEELADLNAGFPVRVTFVGSSIIPMAVDTEPV